MVWERMTVRLACGCGFTPPKFDTYAPGDSHRCPAHGEQKVKRVSKVRYS